MYRWILTAAVGLTVAPSRPLAGEFTGGPEPLVNSKTALAAIKATGEQVGQLKEWARQSQTRQAAAVAAATGLSREEQRGKLAAMSADAWKQLGGVLKPEQVKRLRQIELQVAGSRAFFRGDVAEALKITAAQQTKMQDAFRVLAKDLAAVRDTAGGKAFEEKAAGLGKEMLAACVAALTDDQKKQWKEMVGEPIDTAKVEAEIGQ